MVRSSDEELEERSSILEEQSVQVVYFHNTKMHYLNIPLHLVPLPGSRYEMAPEGRHVTTWHVASSRWSFQVP